MIIMTSKYTYTSTQNWPSGHFFFQASLPLQVRTSQMQRATSSQRMEMGTVVERHSASSISLSASCWRASNRLLVSPCNSNKVTLSTC